LPSNPRGVSTPTGCSSSEPSARPVGRAKALHVLSRLFRDMSLQPRTAAQSHQPKPATSTSRDAASPGLCCPTTQSRTGGPAYKAANPSATACHVRGLGTSFAASTTDPPGARSAGASMGFAPQGVPLVREWCPFRGPCPPDVACRRARPPRREEWAGRGRLQGLLPATSPCCRSTTHEERRTVDAFSGFAPTELPPHPSGPSLVVTMPALSPLGGMTSRPTWASGRHGADGVAGPFPDCRLSWGFAPCNGRGTPFIASGSGLMVSPRAGQRA
jgi:hypothetical protein